MASNPFIKIELLHLYDGGHHHAIQWTLDRSFKDETPFLFTVQVSETPDFSQLTYTLPASSHCLAIDRTNVLQVNAPSWYYRVKLETGSGAVYYSQSVFHEYKKTDSYKYWQAREIARREFVRMRYTGFPGYIIKRKNYGEIAKKYVDPISGVPISDSSVDNSTGFVGGYHTPLRIRFSEEAQDSKTSLNDDGTGVSYLESLKVRMVGFPVVAPKDIIVTDINGRYVIGDDVTYKYFPGTHILLAQLFVAKLLPFNDVVYNVLINE